MNDSLNRDYGGKAAAEIRERCTECLLCVEECGFLKHQGTPKGIASSLFSDRGCPGDLPFECSLCRLCDAVCPEGLSPADMFLTLRAECLRDNPSILSRYSRLLRYERLGSSKLLSLRAFPDDCDTVFFPGCNLPGSMPGATERLVREMSLRIPRLGIVIDCCNRPSHDLGREAFFRERFGTQMADLRNHGIAMLITACPNCHELFSRYATGLHVISAFSLMAEWGITVGARGDAALTIHDPCAFRFRGEVTAAARKLLSDSGISFREMTHNGRNTICCGEGGAVERVNRN
ncbi:MAG: (Fe-S)-binding protein, partial [Chrysiogenales bacterium]